MENFVNTKSEIFEYNLSLSDSIKIFFFQYWCAEKQVETTMKLQQLFGGYGYMTEYPIANLFAGARVQTIYGGTTEIMKELIARTI